MKWTVPVLLFDDMRSVGGGEHGGEIEEGHVGQVVVVQGELHVRQLND